MVKALAATKLMDSTQGQRSKPSHKKRKCFNCIIKGHLAEDCGKPKKSNGKPQGEAHIATADSHILFVTMPNSKKEEILIWYIDSGASQHMSCKKDWMLDYSEFRNPEKVRLGDNKAVQAFGKGTVWLKVKSGDLYMPVEFPDVLYVHSLASNLLSDSAVTNVVTPTRALIIIIYALT